MSHRRILMTIFWNEYIRIVSSSLSVSQLTRWSLSQPLSVWKMLNMERSFLGVNECLVNNGGCDHYCVDTWYSYYCTCRSSYDLVDINQDCRKYLMPLDNTLIHCICIDLKKKIRKYILKPVRKCNMCYIF